jgi:hypothetical protein
MKRTVVDKYRTMHLLVRLSTLHEGNFLGCIGLRFYDIE